MGNRLNRRRARKASEAVDEFSFNKGVPLSFCQTCITNGGRKDLNSKVPARKRLTDTPMSVYSSVITVETDEIYKPVVLISS